MTAKSPLHKLESFGQSIWIDYIERSFFLNNKLKKMIEEYSLRGMTSNPSIFEKAITESSDYNDSIKQLTDEGRTVEEIYENLTLSDVKNAADVFRALFDETKGKDGYVSLEVNPHLAHDAEKTIAEARKLWHALDRPNVFIKVPATKEGLKAIKQLISEGINVNVTLLFGIPRYKEVAEAYISGLEQCAAVGHDISKITSVASFFLSRIDVLLDPILEKQINSNDVECAQLAKQALGQIAIASAKLAYLEYQKIFNGERFKKLQEKGAKVQRLLWASTSTKNKNYSDVKYVEALIGQDTVNTLPLETIEAYHDHGKPESRLTQDIELSKQVFDHLPKFDIHIDHATQELEDEGVKKFIDAYDKLISAIKIKMSKQ